MTNDLMKLMAYIDSLQSEPTPEPIIETEETKVHPLLQAMQELKEEGIVDSVDAHTIYSIVQSGHREPGDFIEGDIGDRIYWFDDYKKTSLPISNLNLDEHYVDDDLVDDYVELIKSSPNTTPPIVFDPIANSIIDGIHRANAYAKLGYDTIPAYVGLTKSDTYGEREGIDEYVNKDTVTPGFKKEKWIMGGKYKLVATARDRDDDKDAEGLIIKVMDPTDDSPFRPGEVGSVRLIVNGDGSYEDKALVASLLGVNDSHQRKGLASAMYQFARELGNDVLPSKAQSDMGKAFWKGGAGVGRDFPEEMPPEPEAKQEPVEPEVKPEEKKPFWKRLFKEDEYTFNQERRQLNIPELIKRGAFYITHPHGPDGWETDRPDWDFSLITLQNILQKSPDWSVEYKKYIRPESYNKATQEFFSKLSDQKYQQILWSIKKLGIPDDVAFLDKLDEASPNTLEGSFTPDLVESKTWLAKMLAKGLKGKNAGTIYVLGSWYGNMGIFLQQVGVKFDKLVLVEPDEESLMRSKELLDTLNDDGKLILIHQKAEDIVFEKPGVVINTSCNETGPVFLTKLPDNMLCLLQARNNVDNVLIETNSLEEFKELFPLNKTYFTGEKQLTDPETEYTRYMIVGRSGKKLDETISTGQGGGSAGVGGGQMVGGPTTYEEEYGMFQRKNGPRRITAMTNEALDTSYEYVSGQKPGVFYFDTEDGNEYKVELVGNDKKTEVSFAQRGQGDEHKTGITGTGNSRKIFGTIVNIVQNYINKVKPEFLTFTANNNEPSRLRLYKTLASQSSKVLPNYKFSDALNDGLFTTYYLARNDIKVPVLDKIKAAGFKTLDRIIGESTITLNKLYSDNKPHRDDTIWDYGTMIWDNEYPIETINPNKLTLYLMSQYNVEHVEELFDMMDEEQQEIVEKYVNDPSLSDKIIVLDNGYIVDGNHRALAAVLANKPINYIDIGGEEDESS